MIMNNEVANENEKVLLDRIKELEDDQKNFRNSTEERFNRIWAMCNRVKCVICKCTFNSSNKRAIIHPMGKSICEECANPTTLGNAQDLLDTSLDDQVQNEARLFANSSLNSLIKDLESEHRNHSGQNV
uniref:Uncharacterized protein n=1 Tax=Biomphalaria glabrata TaxID=6526 RepID=A0A2C9M3K3_BIOGL